MSSLDVTGLISIRIGKGERFVRLIVEEDTIVKRSIKVIEYPLNGIFILLTRIS